MEISIKENETKVGPLEIKKWNNKENHWVFLKRSYRDIYKSITKKKVESTYMERKYMKNVAYLSFNYFSRSWEW